MSYEELVKFFNKFSFDSLETLNLLVPLESKTENKAFINVYNEKFDEEGDIFEENNKFDDKTRLLNFSLKEVNDKINLFNKNELIYLKRILSTIPEKKGEIYYDIIESQLDGCPAYDKLKTMFDKYSLFELDTLKAVLSYVQDYDMRRVFRALEDVYANKERECCANPEKIAKSTRPSYISRKNKKLSDEELNFLAELVENASFYLSSVRDFSDEYDNVIEDFDIDEYPIDLVFDFEQSLYEEIEDRNYETKDYKKELR